MNRMLRVAVALTLPLWGMGCRGGDCEVVCEQRQSCFNADLDVDKCANNCNAKAADQGDYRAKAEECAQCVESRTCAESLKFCLDDCFGV